MFGRAPLTEDAQDCVGDLGSTRDPESRLRQRTQIPSSTWPGASARRDLSGTAANRLLLYGEPLSTQPVRRRAWTNAGSTRPRGSRPRRNRSARCASWVLSLEKKGTDA